MKTSRAWTVLLPASTLLFAACKNEKPVAQEAAGAPELVEAVLVEEVVTAVPVVADLAEPAAEPAAVAAPVVAAMTVEERAAKLGIVGHLAGDTEAVMAIYDGKGMVKSLRSLNTWKTLREIAQAEMDFDPEEMVEEEGFGEVAPFLENEFFMAFGKTTAEQMDGMAVLQARMGYYQMRTMSRALAQGVVSGDVEKAMSALENPEWMMEMVGEIDDLMPTFEAAQVPPVLVGLKVTDAEAMGMAEEELRSMLGMMGEEGDVLEFEKAGAKFDGYLFKGADLAAEMEQDREEVDEMVGKENLDQVIAAVKKKNLAVAMGKMGDYLLLYVGGSSEACPLVADVNESLAASERIKFVDGYKDLPVHGFLFGDKALLGAANSGGLKEMAEGIRDGMQGAEGLGDTRELVSLLDMVGEREKALMDLYKVEALGGIITVDGGARFELYGGGDSRAIDYEKAHQLASLGAGDDVLMFANWVSGSEYKERVGDLMGVLVEASYSLTSKLAAVETQDGDLKEIQEQFQMFDQLFRKDVIGLWDGMSEAGEGLGTEAALVVDLKGAFPPIPGVPQEIVEAGRFIRGSYIAPVTDRAKIGSGWRKMDASMRAILKSASEAGFGDISMLVPTDSERDGVKTWYFDALAFSDDVKPSVTISDDWFVASSSRTQALDLMAKAKTSEAGPRKGAWMSVDLDVLREYLEEAVKLVDENGELVFPDEADLADFREGMPSILKGLAAMEEFEAVTLHDRMEGDQRRVSLHFKTR